MICNIGASHYETLFPKIRGKDTTFFLYTQEFRQKKINFNVFCKFICIYKYFFVILPPNCKPNIV